MLEECHRGRLGGHFSAERVFKSLISQWWWEGMYKDVYLYVKNCPECAIVSGSGKSQRPPLCPIPVKHPFQILGMDIMALPKTTRGNQYVLVFQDFLTKWPCVFPLPDQQIDRIVKILAEDIIPFFGVPEAILSDRGTNLLSHIMLDVCEVLGIQKLNTTAYHSQCDELVECYNRTLKSMLRKHAARYSMQWDEYISSVQWAYRNTPHEATCEKPSYLLFGMDCQGPMETALLLPLNDEYTDVMDYREKLTTSLSSARELAAQAIQKAQRKYKKNYDKRTSTKEYKVGEWILIRFPQEETGRLCKLSRPWHRPYRVISTRGPDVTAVKVYYPQDGQIQVHLSRVMECPPEFPAGYYWYGGKRHGSGCSPKWVDRLLANSNDVSTDRDAGIDPDDHCPIDEDLDSEEPSSVEEDTMLQDDEIAPTADVEEVPLDPRRTRMTYGLRDHITLPHCYM